VGRWVGGHVCSPGIARDHTREHHRSRCHGNCCLGRIAAYSKAFFRLSPLSSFSATGESAFHPQITQVDSTGGVLSRICHGPLVARAAVQETPWTCTNYERHLCCFTCAGASMASGTRSDLLADDRAPLGVH